MKKSEQPSKLVAAALALDADLREFEHLSESVGKAALNSEKNLSRASRTLSELVQVGEALQGRLGDLVLAIAGLRESQEARVAVVQKKSEELKERSKMLESLLLEYRGIGQHAKDLKEELQSFDGEGKNEGGTLDGKLAQLAEEAERLFDRAQSLDFPEVANQADALRQQLQAIRNKLNMLQKSLPQA